jgi:hypothetical protein
MTTIDAKHNQLQRMAIRANCAWDTRNRFRKE